MKTVSLGEVAKIERHTVDPATLEPSTKYIGLEHIERGGRLLGHSTVEEAKLASTKFQFSVQHVLYGKLRPNLGKISRPKHAGVCSTDILPIRPGKHLDRDFLAHYLAQPHMIDFAANLASGANLPRLSPAALETFPVPLPHIWEQRRIAAILDHADALRAKRRQVLAHLDSLTQSIFHKMFHDSGAYVEFGEVIARGPTNGLYRPASDYGSGTPILRIDGFDRGVIHEKSWKRVRIDPSEIARFALSPGDIIINRVNALSHLGKSAIIAHIQEPSVFESNMMRITVDTDRALPGFVIAWLQTSAVKHQILRKAKKAINQASINQADVSTLRLPLPPRPFQQEFVDTAARVRRQGDKANHSLWGLNELFESLRSRAFRGEL